MSVEKVCSLCCSPCKHYEYLQRETIEEPNKIYEITIKYFDPVLLTEDVSDKVNVLCQTCWCHIKDFHEFRMAVIKSRSELQELSNYRLPPMDIKEEDALDIDDFCKEKLNKRIDEDNLIKEEEIENDCFNRDDDDDMYVKCDNAEIEKLATQQKDNSKSCKSSKSKQDFKKPSRKRKDNRNPNQVDKGIDSDKFIAEWKPELECDLCSAIETNFENLRFHFKEKHNVRSYIKCCERKFYRRHLLVEHLKFHLNPETHKCDICGKISSTLCNLKLHKNTMHGKQIKQFQCEVCQNVFNLKSTLKRHMLQHNTSKDFVCQECGKAFAAEVLLKVHTSTVHNCDRVCEQCGKTIHGKVALKQHLMQHAGIKKPTYPCDQCDAELHSRSSLKRHTAALHDSSTAYVCSICGKVASCKSSLLAHKRNVHNEDDACKYKCTFCDKTFRKPKMLREHISTHTGENPYQCPHCPRRFRISSNMHHHRKKVHPVEWERGRKKGLTAVKFDINEVENKIVV